MSAILTKLPDFHSISFCGGAPLAVDKRNYRWVERREGKMKGIRTITVPEMLEGAVRALVEHQSLLPRVEGGVLYVQAQLCEPLDLFGRRVRKSIEARFDRKDPHVEGESDLSIHLLGCLVVEGETLTVPPVFEQDRHVAYLELAA